MSKNKELSRRKFLAGSAVLAAASVAPVSFAMGNNPSVSQQKTDSNFGGVHIGAITYSWRTMPGGLENIVKYCQECGISSIELMSGDLETYLGAPESPMMAIFMEMRQQAAQQAEGEDAPPRRRGRPNFTPEQQARIDKYNEEVREFRLNVDMKKVASAINMLHQS